MADLAQNLRSFTLGSTSIAAIVGDRMSQADIAVAAFWQFGMEKRPNFLARMACPRIQGLSDRRAATPPFLNTLPGEGLPKGIALE